MSRVGGFAIQGFLYQFHKTLLEILRADDEGEITVEGIVEDIEIFRADGSLEALQCKYHQSREKYVPSVIFRPLLQMMVHFSSTKLRNISYRLFVHIPSEPASCRNIESREIDSALNSKSNQDLIGKITEAKFDKSEFQKVCKLEFGKSLAGIEDEVVNEFKSTSLSNDSIQLLFYPNSINEIAKVSIRPDPLSRKVKKKEFLKTLEGIQKTQISKWTLGLRSRDKILQHRRKQLKNNLSKNSRNRCFIISEYTIEEFDDKIVLFIQDYINEYHFKANHEKPPSFYLECASNLFLEIRERLHNKGIKFTTGLEVIGKFDNDHFYREPLTRQIDSYHVESEFQIRLACHDDKHSALMYKGFDDLYFVSESSIDIWDQDVEIERLPFTDFNHLKYILGLADVIE